jgi:nicotinamidase-related amidase
VSIPATPLPAPALVVIDLQRRVVANTTEPRTAAQVVETAAELARAFRTRSLPVFFVRTQNLDREDLPGDELVPELGAEPSDIQILKHQFGAFHGTPLDLHLRRLGRRTLVLCGLMTNFGVESTARAADEYGYAVCAVEDALASVTRDAHRFSIAEIFSRLGEVRSAAEVIALLTEPKADAGPPVLEIRTFKLRSGTASDFDRLANVVARPLQEECGIEVVAAYPSLEDGEHYLVVRRFASESKRLELEEAFYSSPAWIDGPRDAVLALVEAYHSVVLPLASAHAHALVAALVHTEQKR